MVTADIPAIMIYKELKPEFRIFSPRCDPLPGILLLGNGTNIYLLAQTRKLRDTINPSLPHIIFNPSPGYLSNPSISLHLP